MSRIDHAHTTKQAFNLSKWFLDFTGDDGETLIFYSARMTWHQIQVDYTSWLHSIPGKAVQSGFRFTNARTPILFENRITWNDPKFGFSGTWEATAPPIRERIFNSAEGCLDWHCYQPAAKVQLQTGTKTKNGRGYAEQLTLTVPPWKIPMDELRWGRFISETENLVWIELKSGQTSKWLWRNGETVSHFEISDEQVILPGSNAKLKLDRWTVLESEKKIASVAGKIVSYIPGFNKLMPLNFLLADETKWLSHGQFSPNGLHATEGFAIHELVQFNTHKQ